LLVVPDPVGFEKRHEVLLKRPAAVMLLLAFDIVAHLVGLRRANGEGAVAGLPGESAQFSERVMNPTGRIRPDGA
jgi:hypothetical protein